MTVTLATLPDLGPDDRAILCARRRGEIPGQVAWDLDRAVDDQPRLHDLPGPALGPAPGPPPGPMPDLAAAQSWVAQFVHAALQVSAGRRPPSQLARWTSPPVLAGLERRHQLALRTGSQGAPFTVRFVRVEQVRPTVLECCAVVADRTRARAVALQVVVGGHSRWRVTVLELG